MDRRRFLSTTVAGILAAPLAAEAQEARNISKLGVLPPTAALNRVALTAAAHALRIELQESHVHAPGDLETAVHKAKGRGAQALYVWPSGLALRLEDRHPTWHSRLACSPTRRA
jgi:hypothetical protein